MLPGLSENSSLFFIENILVQLKILDIGFSDKREWHQRTLPYNRELIKAGLIKN
jgi:hypothetical protein